ncbi:hypothetical protein HZ326_13732 [Fusarium oxysporum f. sp. albedinis]|nr:hypothetical protein HZ326_13732 [Fusarium oxysporum f. sp. albedinis]
MLLKESSPTERQAGLEQTRPDRDQHVSLQPLPTITRSKRAPILPTLLSHPSLSVRHNSTGYPTIGSIHIHHKPTTNQAEKLGWVN